MKNSKRYDLILALDPSGAFNEGKGTTGWCLFDANQMLPLETGFINASKFDSMEAFWDAHIKLINITRADHENGKFIVVIEDFLLYAHKAEAQINSRMETPKLIGVLQHYCWAVGFDYIMQTASEVKTRWTDEILAHKGYLVPRGKGYALKVNPNKAINRHCKDSIRHAVHFATFKNGR